MEWMWDQNIMVSSWGGLYYEYLFQDLVKGVQNLECAYLLWRDNNYIFQTKQDEICG